MPKKKLKKFADNEKNPLVFQYPYRLLAEEGCPQRGNWSRSVFGNDRPIVVELGCGKGEYTVALARQNPDFNYIGIDRKGARIWTGASQAFSEGMTNVAFIRTDIHLIAQIFSPGEVDQIWITFPDPQMKKPRARLISSVFFGHYTQFLKPGGFIHLKTDSTFLYTYAQWLLETNKIKPFADTDDLYAGDNASKAEVPFVLTFYEKQWLLRGKSIKYLRFALPHLSAFQEPSSEPEHDDYTSWTRIDVEQFDVQQRFSCSQTGVDPDGTAV